MNIKETIEKLDNITNESIMSDIGRKISGRVPTSDNIRRVALDIINYTIFRLKLIDEVPAHQFPEIAHKAIEELEEYRQILKEIK